MRRVRFFRVRLASAIAAAWASLITGQLLAEVPDLSLDWNAPSDCPAQKDVLRAVEHLLGAPSRSALSEPIAASVHVRRQGASTWSAELHTTNQGRRTLRGESCAAIASATAVVLALAIDPEALSRARTSAPVAEGAPPLSRQAPRPRRRANVVRAAERPSRDPAPLVPTARASVGGVFGLLPELSVTSALGLGLRYRAFSVELGGSWALPREQQHQRWPEVTVRVGLWSGALLGCFSPLSSRSALDLCLGAELEFISASARGVTDPGDGRATLGAGLLALRGRQRIERSFSLVLELAGTARPHHPSFVVAGVGTVHDIPSLAAAASLGFVVDL